MELMGSETCALPKGAIGYKRGRKAVKVGKQESLVTSQTMTCSSTVQIYTE
jgi:hypothetical protein